MTNTKVNHRLCDVLRGKKRSEASHRARKLSRCTCRTAGVSFDSSAKSRRRAKYSNWSLSPSSPLLRAPNCLAALIKLLVSVREKMCPMPIVVNDVIRLDCSAPNGFCNYFSLDETLLIPLSFSQLRPKSRVQRRL